MSHHSHERRGLFWPISLIVIGFLFLFQNLGYLDVGDIISNYWPALLIIWGISLIFKRPHSSEKSSLPNKGKMKDEPVILSTEQVAYSKNFGDLNIKIDSKNFQGGDINNTFGKIHLNLQEIELSEGESKLFVNGVFGDIHVALPKNIAYKIEGGVTGGSITVINEKVDGFSKQLSLQTDDYDSATKKLKIVISLTFGDVVVW
ncbi:MAG: cell wall-active antibiotics response protein [Calditrichaeota bacterium]|nr:cell wall-active antibiotics response protein [Calditrichota bacterium]